MHVGPELGLGGCMKTFMLLGTEKGTERAPGLLVLCVREEMYKGIKMGNGNSHPIG